MKSETIFFRFGASPMMIHVWGASQHIFDKFSIPNGTIAREYKPKSFNYDHTMPFLFSVYTSNSSLLKSSALCVTSNRQMRKTLFVFPLNLIFQQFCWHFDWYGSWVNDRLKPHSVSTLNTHTHTWRIKVRKSKKERETRKDTKRPICFSTFHWISEVRQIIRLHTFKSTFNKCFASLCIMSQCLIAQLSFPRLDAFESHKVPQLLNWRIVVIKKTTSNL